VPWPLEPPLLPSTERIVRGVDGWTEHMCGEKHRMNHKTATARTRGHGACDAIRPIWWMKGKLCAPTVEQRVCPWWRVLCRTGVG